MSNHRIIFSCGHTRNKPCQYSMEDTESTAPNVCSMCSLTHAENIELSRKVKMHLRNDDRLKEYLHLVREMDEKTFLDRITPLIRDNAELIYRFRDLMGYDWRDDAIDRDFGEDLRLEGKDPAPLEKETVDLTEDGPSNQSTTDNKASQPIPIANADHTHQDRLPPPRNRIEQVWQQRNALSARSSQAAQAVINAAANDRNKGDSRTNLRKIRTLR